MSERPANANAPHPPAPEVHHEPLSRLLARLLENPDPATPLTMNLLLGRTEGRGVYLLIILISLPFLLPTPFFGLSTPMGIMMMTLALRHALELPPRLPRRIGNHPLPDGFKSRILGGSVKVLARLERWVKPRRDQWLNRPVARWINCGLISTLALILALPLPPVIPFTNSVPAIAIMLICLSMMEEDGVLIWFGYLAVIGNVIFFSSLLLSIGAVLKYWSHWWEVVKSWL